MDNVLITGGSHAEIPIIESIHELGYQVISTGLNKSGLGHLAADRYIQGDFSDIRFVERIAKENHVVGIVSGCNDFAYLSTAYACDRLGFKGHDSFETSKTIHNKNLFRKLLKRLELPAPVFFKCSDRNELDGLKKDICMPVLVKPVDLTGGKGVSVCENWDDVKDAFDYAMSVTREKYVIIEEYIEGNNHGFSGLIKNKHVVFSFFDNEEYYLNKYLVSGAYSPSDLNDEEKKSIVDQVNKIADELNLCDGLFHCQCIVTNDSKCYLIDPCRRAPGDLYISLVEYATGIDYPLAITKSELGMDISKELYFTPSNRCISRECIMTNKNGIIKDIVMDDEYKKNVFRIIQWGKPGDVIDDYYKYKAGIVFFRFPDVEEMSNKMRYVHEKMTIEVIENE